MSRFAQLVVRSGVVKSLISETVRNLSIASIMSESRVLSIQSHVVHGYCGNKSAVFPLQVSFK